MPTAAELLAALPADDVDVNRPDHAEELEAIFRSLAGRGVPTGAFHRLCLLGGLSTKLGLAYLAYWIRSWYKPTAAREQDLLETNLRGALSTLETMGYLRGAVAKLGQLVATFPETVPREIVDVLSHLHFQAPPMHFSLIREQLLNEFLDPQDIFSEFDETAIAAASLGQVHRARLKTGEQVAVKVQYPGIARTIRADLRNLKSFMRPFHSSSNWQGLEEIFEEIRVGLESETDYEQEAQNLRDVQRLFLDDDNVWVPSAFESASTRRVLTMEFIEGKPLDEFLATNPTQQQRDDFGTTISMVLYRIFINRMLYTDAHPGNFLFLDDGRLGFIDFGNLRRFTDSEWQYHLSIGKARYGTDQEIEAACKRSLKMTDEDAKQHPEMLRLVIEGFQYYNEPVLYEGKFDYGDPDYLRRGAEWLAKASKQRWLKQEPVNVFAHRLNFQLPALLFGLKSRVNVPQILRDEYDGASDFPTGPNR